MSRTRPQLDLVTSALLVLLFAASASAQVRIDGADERVIGELRRVESLLAERQWDEAIETIRRVEGSDGDRLYKIDAWRYVPVRQYTRTLLGKLPPEALKRYRDQVDPAAKQDYLAGRFERVVREAYASYAGKSLLALGEMALASGDADQAYRLWEQILPTNDIDPAAVRARLILASILGGHSARARAELAKFVELHPHARGRFAGRDDADYAEVLETLLDEPTVESRNTGSNSAWPTFAGNPARNRAASRAVDVRRVVWRRSLDSLRLSPPFLRYEHEPHRKDLRLAFHPALDRDRLFISAENGILGLDIRSGKPLWESRDGLIYREMKYGENEKTSNSAGPLTDINPKLPEGTLGVPQFTTTLRDDQLYARVGTPLTNRASTDDTGSIDAALLGRDAIVCLDLKAEGRLVWRIEPDGKDWAFDGTPVVDGKHVYVAMRRGGLRPESHVACFDAARGTMRWRQFVCSALTRSSDDRTPGSQPECTSNLLTLHHDTLYLNTNLGTIASLEAETGLIRWVTLYPQTNSENRPIPPAYTARTLAPCVYDRGTLYVAASDSAAIFALDAFSGELLWATGQNRTAQTSDAVHLLGTLGDRLIASGDRLYWIATSGEHRGQIVRRFPDGEPLATHGRGILAENRIYWPTRERLFVFEDETLVKTIDLPSLGLTGGNLTIAGNRLLITTDREITAVE